MDVTQFTNQLRAEREQIDRQIKLLSDRRKKVDTALSALEDLAGVPDEAPTEPSAARVATADAPVGASSEPPGEPRAETRTPRDAGPQAALQRLLHERPGQEFDSKSAHALLLHEGWSTTSKDPVNVVRSALAVLAGEGEITRVGRGKYVYDPAAVVEVREPASSTRPVVPGTLDFVDSDYGSGSYSSGTSLQSLDEQAG